MSKKPETIPLKMKLVESEGRVNLDSAAKIFGYKTDADTVTPMPGDDARQPSFIGNYVQFYKRK